MVRVRNRQFAVLFISAHSDGTLRDWCCEQNQNSRAQANDFQAGDHSIGTQQATSMNILKKCQGRIEELPQRCIFQIPMA